MIRLLLSCGKSQPLKASNGSSEVPAHQSAWMWKKNPIKPHLIISKTISPIKIKKKKKNPSYFSSPPLLCCHGHGHRYPQFQLLSQTTFARPPSSLPWLFSFSSWWSELSSCKWFFSSHGFCESLFSFPKWFFSQDIPDITFWHKFFIISISLLYPRFFIFFFTWLV